MDGLKFIGNNSPEDVKWLCSLSESELDMLISLKMLALQRAKVVGHESLAKKFDLKTLRALGFVLMQYVKGQVKDLQLPGISASKDLLDGCNLLKLDFEDNVQCIRNEDLMAFMGMDKKKRADTGSSAVAPDFKRQKNV